MVASVDVSGSAAAPDEKAEKERNAKLRRVVTIRAVSKGKRWGAFVRESGGSHP